LIKSLGINGYHRCLFSIMFIKEDNRQVPMPRQVHIAPSDGHYSGAA